VQYKQLHGCDSQKLVFAQEPYYWRNTL